MQPEIRKTAFGMECNIPWEEMQDLRPGCKFCAHCSREIVDYRNLSRNEVNTLLSSNEKICGVFDISQFAYEVKLPNMNFLAGLLIPLWLLSDPTDVIGKVLKTELQIQVPKKYSTQSEKKVQGTEPQEINIKHERKWYGPRRLFISKRFPFIHFRKRYYGGSPIYK